MKPIRVGLLGLGTVGGGTIEVLRRNREEIARRAGREIAVVMASARDLAKPRAVALEAADGRILNVGSGGHYSVNRLVELIGGEVAHIPKRPGEPDCTYADTSRIASVLGWRAAVPFEEGVARVVEQIESWRDAPVWTPATIATATEDWFRYLGRDGKPDTEGRIR